MLPTSAVGPANLPFEKLNKFLNFFTHCNVIESLEVAITREPLQIMYTEFAVVVGVIAVNLPFVVLTLQAVLEGIDRAIEEAALNLGAHPVQAFFRVTLPAIRPGIVAGSLLVLVMAGLVGYVSSWRRVPRAEP